MSIRPVDFQVMYTKTSELSKTYSDEANKHQAVNQQLAEQNRDRADNNLKQVVARENVHGGKVEEKQERDKSKEQKDKKKQQKKSTEIVPTIDIKI
ncbi:hypothetical protein LY28_00445 [Ruminiclostridium sufflavum DSM 19573]|uniref:Uncharacterized protein n=1 Tax=Ruminiclostridium sufflavum DSM 19573 TaxID=1121337 RepID=A0A318XQV9_9FIRM|nr:hypothetical protein [Ruminiclostridium sufflavum]PYG89848.1 hypothetical protein LY28_00445 [Ruminiclostridium sufflavum DSM 19573]